MFFNPSRLPSLFSKNLPSSSGLTSCKSIQQTASYRIKRSGGFSKFRRGEREWFRKRSQGKGNAIYSIRQPPIPHLKVAGPPQPEFTTKPWDPKTRRVGVLAQKLGMLSLWDEWGRHTPTTVLKVEENFVVNLEPYESGNHTKVSVGAFYMKSKRRLKRHHALMYYKAGVRPKKKLIGWNVTNNAVPLIGTEIRATHFVPGQYVDCQAKTQGKGTQGVMKRWGFKGQKASHGASLSHRSAGAIGANQDPGRVWKGKKMAGKMGNKKRTIQNLKVVKVDKDLNLIYVKGAVPGPKYRFIKVTDAKKRSFFNQLHPEGLIPQVPTAREVVGEFRELFPPKGKKDPFIHE